LKQTKLLVSVAATVAVAELEFSSGFGSKKVVPPPPGQSTPADPNQHDPNMIGANGTQVTSKTLWREGKGRIDVENPNPGQRPGQIHYQDGSGKYIYDLVKKEFQGLSKTANENLLAKPEVQQAIQKGLQYLGMSE
jgi:filamentous hemagglutinin